MAAVAALACSTLCSLGVGGVVEVLTVVHWGGRGTLGVVVVVLGRYHGDGGAVVP